MSNRDFIIQEIRKIFSEQQTASQPSRPATQDSAETANSEKTPPQQQTKVILKDLISGKAPESYNKNYEKITPGMDSSDTGNCKVINQKALEVNPKLEDPKFIYSVLANQGVIGDDYALPPQPCNGLDRLIAKFQYMALNRKLRNQKKIDPDGSKIKNLYYKPTVSTPDRAGEFAPVSEQSEGEIAVDGKIGSRTAALFAIFDTAQPKPEPKPSPEPSPNPPEEIKEGGYCKGCRYSFESLDDLKMQTVQTALGVPCNKLKSKKYGSLDNFSDLAIEFITRREADLSVFEDLKKKITKAVTSVSNQREIFSKITLPDIQKLKNSEIPSVPGVVTDIEQFMNYTVSSKIVSLYAGHVGGSNNTYNFAYIVSEGGNIPLVYTSQPNDLSQLKSFMKAVKYNSWATIEPTERGRSSFPSPASLSNLERDLRKYNERLVGFFTQALAGAKRDPRFTTESELGNANDIIRSINMRVEGLLSAMKNFSSNPNQETLNSLGASAGPITSMKKRLFRKRY